MALCKVGVVGNGLAACFELNINEETKLVAAAVAILIPLSDFSLEFLIELFGVLKTAFNLIDAFFSLSIVQFKSEELAFDDLVSAIDLLL